MRAFGTVVGLTRRQIETRARLIGFAVLGVVALVVAWRVGTVETLRADRAAVRLTEVFTLGILAPVVAVVFGSAALGGPRDDGTLVYLWARPRPRRTLAIGAMVAAAIPALPLTVVPATVAAAVVGASQTTVVAVAAATAATAVAHLSVFLALGTLTSRALLWGMAYVLVVESFVARGGAALGALSINAHAASVLSDWADESIRVAYFEPVASWITLAAVTVAGLLVTVWRLRRGDLD